MANVFGINNQEAINSPLNGIFASKVQIIPFSDSGFRIKDKEGMGIRVFPANGIIASEYIVTHEQGFFNWVFDYRGERYSVNIRQPNYPQDYYRNQDNSIINFFASGLPYFYLIWDDRHSVYVDVLSGRPSDYNQIDRGLPVPAQSGILGSVQPSGSPILPADIAPEDQAPPFDPNYLDQDQPAPAQPPDLPDWPANTAPEDQPPPFDQSYLDQYQTPPTQPPDLPDWPLTPPPFEPDYLKNYQQPQDLPVNEEAADSIQRATDLAYTLDQLESDLSQSTDPGYQERLLEAFQSSHQELSALNGVILKLLAEKTSLQDSLNNARKRIEATQLSPMDQSDFNSMKMNFDLCNNELTHCISERDKLKSDMLAYQAKLTPKPTPQSFPSNNIPNNSNSAWGLILGGGAIVAIAAIASIHDRNIHTKGKKR